MNTQRLKYWAILFLMLSVIYNLLAAQEKILDQKKELEGIKSEMETSEKQLDSLRSAEKKILKEISDYEQRATINKTVLDRLNKQLADLRKSLGDAGDNLNTSRNQYSTSRERFINNIKYYYIGVSSSLLRSDESVQADMDAYRKLIYLGAVAAYDREDLSKSSEYLSSAEQGYRDLKDMERSVDEVRTKKKSEYTIVTSKMETREKDLSKVRRKKEIEADRLVTLAEAARQMEELIDRLENARIAREKDELKTAFDFKTGNFRSYKGGLYAPARGRVVKSFGWKSDDITKLKSFSPGIEIQGKENTVVSCVANGVIAYVGDLRGYGKFIIIEHEDGYYSTYAGLDDLSVEPNQLVIKGEKIGVSKSGRVKFELRQGKEPLDPVEWIRIDSF
jgi:septal ring factor EnvC (AmiA/AmiB activator)